MKEHVLLVLLFVGTTLAFSLPDREGRPDCSPSDTLLKDLAGFRVKGIAAGDTVLLKDSSITTPGRACTVNVASSYAGYLVIARDAHGNLSCPKVVYVNAGVEPEVPKPPDVKPHDRCGGTP
jgi:hypothetical protein